MFPQCDLLPSEGGGPLAVEVGLSQDARRSDRQTSDARAPAASLPFPSPRHPERSPRIYSAIAQGMPTLAYAKRSLTSDCLNI